MKVLIRVLLSVPLSLLSACATTAASAELEVNELPKYGDPTRQTIWDRSAESERPRLIEQSRHASDRGWRFMLDGDISTATKRFNQAWLLHSANVNALHGLAVVSLERAKSDQEAGDLESRMEWLDRAVALAEEAVELDPRNPPLLTDAALIHVNRGDLPTGRSPDGAEKASQDLDRAEALLRRARAEAEHPLIYRTWAALETVRGNEQEAKEYERQAKDLERHGRGG